LACFKTLQIIIRIISGWTRNNGTYQYSVLKAGSVGWRALQADRSKATDWDFREYFKKWVYQHYTEQLQSLDFPWQSHYKDIHFS